MFHTERLGTLVERRQEGEYSALCRWGTVILELPETETRESLSNLRPGRLLYGRNALLKPRVEDPFVVAVHVQDEVVAAVHDTNPTTLVRQPLWTAHDEIEGLLTWLVIGSED